MKWPLYPNINLKIIVFMKKEKSIFVLTGWGFLLSALFVTIPSAEAAYQWEGGRGIESREQRVENNREQRGESNNRWAFRFHFGGAVYWEVENVSDGVRVTMTSDDSEVVRRLQAKKPRVPHRLGVLHSQETIEKGIRFTLTSDDPEQVEKIQRFAKKKHSKNHEGEPHIHERRKRGGKGFRKEVERVMTPLPNGIAITLTSEKEEVVERLQARKPKTSQRDGVTRTRELIENGVRVVITADDSVLVEKIQRRAEKKGRHRKNCKSHDRRESRNSSQ